ncbi:MAG TPA: PA2779 family protein [Noviherbaspirillum sp.]
MFSIPTLQLRKLFVLLLLGAFAFISFTQPVRAAMIGTDQVMAAETVRLHQDKVAGALNRPDVIAQLERFGVSKADAEARVAALSDAEVAALSDRVDQLPAGGDFFAVIGFVVVVLVITDLLGLTHVFPFTRK